MLCHIKIDNVLSLYVFWLQLWQAFVGVRARRVTGYYDGLLSTEADTENGNANDHESSNSNDSEFSKATRRCIPEKWKGQIEKVVM